MIVVQKTVARKKDFPELYQRWAGMISRCTNPKNKRYHRYGGRGITVCAGWQKFSGFVESMGVPTEGMTIERKNNDLGYWCGKCVECEILDREFNCKWATRKEQARNKVSNVIVDFRGNRVPLATLAEDAGVALDVAYERYRRGYPIDDCLKKGYLKSGENGANAKFTWDQIRAIRSEFSAGNISKAALGRKFNTTDCNIKSIVNLETWKE